MAVEKSIRILVSPFCMETVSKNLFINSGGYLLNRASSLTLGILYAKSNAARVKIFCCKFSVILN